MKAARAFLERLARLGIEDCFLVPGGAIMHLVDELAQMQSQYVCKWCGKFDNGCDVKLKPLCSCGGEWACNDRKIRAWPMHDERAAAMAAEGYARVKGKPALLLVSSGPGVLNALNGVWGAYVDSVPMIVVSGQVRSDTVTNDNYLRQLGDQELPTRAVVTCIVKMDSTIDDGHKLHQTGHAVPMADHAWWLCQEGRPGPVWLNWCVDKQALESSWEPDRLLPTYLVHGGDNWPGDPIRRKPSADAVSEALAMFAKAKRPVVIVGNGVPYHCPELRAFLDVAQIPLVSAFHHDQIDHAHGCWIGRQGTLGDRAGNLAAQRADLLLVIGCRMSIRQVTYDWDRFSPDSKRIHVDIDHAEIRKPTFLADLPIQADSVEFLKALTEEWVKPVCRNWGPGGKRVEWFQQCQQWRDKYPTTDRIEECAIMKRDWQNDFVQEVGTTKMTVGRRHTDTGLDPYLFLSDLFAKLPDDVTIVTSDATAYIVSAQVSTGRHRQFSNSGCASMGYGIAAAIGAAIAGSKVLCVEGDGSIMQNLSCLASLAEFNLPVNVVVLCNGGYASIKATHQRIFGRQPLEPKMTHDFDWVHQWGWSCGSCNHGTVDASQFVIERLCDNFETRRLFWAQLDPSIPIEPRLEARVVDGKIVTATLDKMTPEVEE